MKKGIIVSSVISLLLLGAIIWFWSLGSVPREEAQKVVLHVTRPSVSVRRPNSTTWEDVTGDTILTVGWSVKTAENAQATITFFNQAESRLDQNSELTIGDASGPAPGSSQSSILLNLDIGRVWSRVLRLFDLDSSYSVKTASVVATVRGTAFDVRANADKSTEVLVAESAVTVTSLNGGPLSATANVSSTPALAEGYVATYGSNGKKRAVKEITGDMRAGGWFLLNRIADASFVRSEQEQSRAAIRKLGGMSPDSPLVGVSNLSEQLHLLVSNDIERDRLAIEYTTRRLGLLIDLVQTGKAGLASQELARIENEARTTLSGTAGEKARRELLVALGRISPLLEDAEPTSALYPFKQRVEDMMLNLKQDDRVASLFARLLTSDARMDEAVKLMDANGLEEVTTALDAAKNGIENVARDAEPMYSDMKPEQHDAFIGKLLALRARETALRVRLESAISGPSPAITPTSTSTSMTAPTSTTPSVQPPVKSATSTSPTVGTPQYRSIKAFIQPNPLTVGQTATLAVKATRLDNGKEEDVTAITKFYMVRGTGNLNGPSFKGTVAGTVTIEASLADIGNTLSATVDETVVGVAVLKSLTLSSTNGTTLSAKTPITQIVSTAVYSDGYQKQVTNLTSLQNSNPAVGTLSGNTFTSKAAPGAAAPVTGSTDIEGTFTENGIMVTGLVTLTVK
jgi:hypothetical protein